MSEFTFHELETLFIGCEHGATGYTAVTLSNLGYLCGHECYGWLSEELGFVRSGARLDGHSPSKFKGESNWKLIHYLEFIKDVPIVHIKRHPLKSIASQASVRLKLGLDVNLNTIIKRVVETHEKLLEVSVFGFKAETEMSLLCEYLKIPYLKEKEAKKQNIRNDGLINLQWRHLGRFSMLDRLKELTRKMGYRVFKTP